MSYYVTQEVYIYPDQPSLTWKQDTALDAPLLAGPKDQATLCRQTDFVTDTGVLVKWTAVAGANFYIVQWCNNSSFNGPTLRAKKTSNTEYELQFSEDIRVGEDVYWRVMAFHNTSGAISGKSEVWQFKYDCSKMSGNLPENQSQQPGGGGGSGTDGSLCDEYNVNVEIKGPENIFCCDKNMWHLTATYDCETRDGTPIVIGGVTWEIKQSGVSNHTILLATNNLVVIFSNPDPGCDDSEKFTIKATVTFTAGALSFDCADEFKVTMDCDTGRPSVKPWMRTSYSGYGVKSYTNPLYVASTLGSIYTEPQWTLNKPILDVEDSIIAVGPVIQVDYKLNTPTPAYTVCDERIDTGREASVIHEARVHIALGCGLEHYSGRIRVKYEDLAGIGLKSWEECGLQVAYGCGLEFYNEELIVNNEDLAGPGLVEYGECGLKIDYGCGLTTYGDGKLKVLPRDLTGYGITVDTNEDCGLMVKQGCGLKFDGTTLVVDNLDLVGPGLAIYGECGLRVTALGGATYAGCGLQTSGITLEVREEDLAGQGLIPDTAHSDCGLKLNLGCGLEFTESGTGDVVRVKAYELAGDGLGTIGECSLKINYGCGLIIEADTLKVDPEDIAGEGLAVDDATACGIKVYYGCGLDIDSDGKLYVDPQDLLGLGLVKGIGECDIAVNAYCGITVDEWGVSISRDDIMGPGLKEWAADEQYSNCGMQIDCQYIIDYCIEGLYVDINECEYCYYIGCGLKLDENNLIIVDNQDLAGSGLLAEGECGLAIDCDYINNYCIVPQDACEYCYYLGCGLKLDENNLIEVNPADLAGAYLGPSGAGCALYVKSTTIEVVTDVYCYASELYAEFDTIIVLTP